MLIIGGGFAGLAAGVALAGAGRRVRVLEQRPYLGGRARSFHYDAAGATVDNGQHIFMGCYSAAIDFLRAIGTLDRVRFQPRLGVFFVDRDGQTSSLKCPPLPAPWHLLGGVLASNSFSFAEKRQIIHLGRALDGRNPADVQREISGLTVDEWMGRMGQSERLRRNFWDLLCIAAINEQPQIAAATVFEPVLRLALFSSSSASRIGFAIGGLSECYTEAAAEYIRARGGVVETGRGVAELILERTGGSTEELAACRGGRLADGSTVESNAVLSAVSSFDLARLLPVWLKEKTPFSDLAAMRPTPIISIHLWFDREISDFEFAGLRGTTVQWFFNKRKMTGGGERHVSLVISGAHDHIHLEKNELLEIALKDLRRAFPRARDAALLHSLVVKERFATFSAGVDVASRRPGPRTPVAGFWLAGDWTDTGLPATIESAVKSGYTAAREILSACAGDSARAAREVTI